MTAETLPPGTTVYHCPMCEWTHAPPSVSGERAWDSLAPQTVFATEMLAVEDAVRGHLEMHPLAEWVAKVGEQQRALELLRTEVARLSADKDRAERDAVMTAGCLVAKLGGSVTITDAEMVNQGGTLVRIPELHGVTLLVRP